ncbi:MAG: hypothetical protein ACLT0Y_00755 [Christensenellales bacterium]
MFSSGLFDAYCVMIIITAFEFLPEALTSIMGFIGNANGFLAMMMIGMMFEMQFHRNTKAGRPCAGGSFDRSGALAALFICDAVCLEIRRCWCCCALRRLPR